MNLEVVLDFASLIISTFLVWKVTVLQKNITKIEQRLQGLNQKQNKSANTEDLLTRLEDLQNSRFSYMGRSTQKGNRR
jgi:hypothetical protein